MSKTSKIPPSEQANLLIDQAMDASTDAKAKQLIEKAVEVDPQCVDGWNLLADFAETEEEALAMFQRSVKIGRDQLGSQFKELFGNFWMAHETRPYMRALEGQAAILRSMGKWPEAIAVWETMLELNPHDNQGVRWSLLEALLFTEANDKAATLIDINYPDDAYALWGWARWLLAFRNNKPNDQLMELMHSAHENNEFVAAILLNDRPLPAEMPAEMTFGQESEALHVARGFLPAFTSTPGAKTWLRQAAADLEIDQTPDPRERARNQKLMLADANEVEQLPSNVWMVQYRKFKFEGEPVWAVLVAVAKPFSVRCCELLDSSPKPDDVLDILLELMLEPGDKHSYRPGVIQFSLKTVAKSLAKRLDSLDIQCEVHPLTEMDEAFKAFRLNLNQNPKSQPTSQNSSGDAEVQREMVWQIGMFRLPNVIEEKGVRTRPWGVMIADKITGMVFGFDLAMELPDAGTIKQLIEQTIQNNPVGRPVLPALIEVRTNDELMTIQEVARSIAVPVAINAELVALDDAVNEFMNRFDRPAMPSTGDIKGLSPVDRTFFYESACQFYKSKPWTRTAPDAIFHVTIPEMDSLYAIPMGQLGSVIGLAVFTNIDRVAAMFDDGGQVPRKKKRKARADDDGRSWSVLFGETTEVSQREIDEIEMLGLPVAGPEAYPELAEIVNGRPAVLKNASDVLRTAICLSAFAHAPLAKSDTLTVPVSIPEKSDSAGTHVVQVTLKSVDI